MVGTYFRVSSDRQAEANGTAAQVEAVNAWLVANRIDPKGARSFTDEAVSGKSMDRPAWNDLMAAIRAGEVDTVVLYDLSRAGRTLRGLLEWIEEMVKLEVRVVFVKDNIDVSTAMGRFILQIMGAVAELERHRINARQSDGIRAKIAKGAKWGAGHHPKLTAAQWANVAAERAKGTTWAALAAQTGLHVNGLRKGLKRLERAKG